jgi:hypothetical protein
LLSVIRCPLSILLLSAASTSRFELSSLYFLNPADHLIFVFCSLSPVTIKDKRSQQKNEDRGKRGRKEGVREGQEGKAQTEEGRDKHRNRKLKV